MELLEFITSPYIRTIVIGFLPITEVRFAIPVGVLQYDFSIFTATILGIIGNTLIPFVVFGAISFFEPILRKIGIFSTILDKIYSYVRKKHSNKFERWSEFALFVIVAIPFPLTGAWSGSLAAYLFNIKPAKAYPLIFAGILASAGIVATLMSLVGTIPFVDIDSL